MDYVIEGIFESWKKSLYHEVGTSRFSSKMRQELIEDLVQMLLEKNVPYEEAASLYSRLKNVLVTKKGLKEQQANYKGWKDTVEKDYKAIVYDMYNERGLVDSMIGEVNKNQPKIDFHPLIDIWGQERFKTSWNENLKVLANTSDTSLHNLFLDEMFA